MKDPSLPIWSEGAPEPRPGTESPDVDRARYERGLEIGRGGMGRVIMARDRELDREVALKEASGPAAAAILHEARITARLEHPGIVPIHGVGHSDEGAWVAMRVVRGRTLTAAIAEAHAGNGRLGLLRHVLDACNAVAWAHHQGIIHRDLKADNIMVGEFGETQVVDWGLAIELDQDTRGKVGTPRFMSPEQARGEAVDRRTDVWALGAVLLHVATGGTPFGASRGGMLGALGDTPPELVAIITRALAVDAAERYPDARALADDLARFLDGRRVAAFTYRPRDVVWRLVKLWRVPITIALVALAMLTTVVVVFIVRLSEEGTIARAGTARALAAEAWTRARAGDRAAAELLAAQALTLAEDPDARGVLLATDHVARPRQTALAALSGAPLALAYSQPLWLEATRDGLRARRGGETLWSRPGGARAASFLAHDSEVRIITADLRILYLDATSGRELASFPKACSGQLASDPSGSALIWTSTGQCRLRGREAPMQMSACGSDLALAAAALPGAGALVFCRRGTTAQEDATARGTLLVIDGAGAVVQRLPLAALTTALAAIPGTTRVATGTNDGRVIVVDLAGARSDTLPPSVPGLVRGLFVSPDGRWLVAYGDASGPRIADLARMSWVESLPPSRVLGFQSDGSLWTARRHLVRWELPEGPFAVTHVPDGVTSLAFSGGTLAATHGEGATLFDPASGAVKRTLRWSDIATKDGAFTPDGRAYFALTPAEPMRRWELPAWESTTLPYRVVGRDVVPLADGRIIVNHFEAGVSLVDAHGHIELITNDSIAAVGASPGEAHHAALLRESDKAILRLDPMTAALATLGHDPDARALEPTRDGDAVLVAGLGGIKRWPGGEMRYRAPDIELMALSQSLDGQLVAAGARDGTVWLWQRDGQLRARFRDHLQRAAALAFDPTGRWLATGSWDATLRLRHLPALNIPAEDLLRTIRAAWGAHDQDGWSRGDALPE